VGAKLRETPLLAPTGGVLWAPKPAQRPFSFPSEGPEWAPVRRVFRLRRSGNVRAISAARFVSHPHGGRSWAPAPSPSRFGMPWERRFGQRPGGFSSSARRWWHRCPFEASFGQQTGGFSSSVGQSWHRCPFEASFGQRSGGFSSSAGRWWHRRPSEASFGQQGGRFSSSVGRWWHRCPFGASFGQQGGRFSSSVGRWWHRCPFEAPFGQRSGGFSSSARRWWWGSRGRFRLAGPVLAVSWRSRPQFAAPATPPSKSLYLPPLFRAFRSFRGPHPTAGHFTRCAGPISRSLLEAVSSGSRFTGSKKRRWAGARPAGSTRQDPEGSV